MIAAGTASGSTAAIDADTGTASETAGAEKGAVAAAAVAAEVSAAAAAAAAAAVGSGCIESVGLMVTSFLATLMVPARSRNRLVPHCAVKGGAEIPITEGQHRGPIQANGCLCELLFDACP